MVEAGFSRGPLQLFVALCIIGRLNAIEVCSNTILPGSKGDLGKKGEEGDQGRLGKTGSSGQPGLPGETGFKGEVGQMGKMGPAGERGRKGDSGADGPAGLKGKPGTTCDCGRYRKLVGQLDINVSKLRNTVQFVKNVILGMKETDEKFYLIVKDARKYRDALMNCKLRGGTLAMPKSREVNRLLADYINQAGLTRVYIGLQSVQNNMTAGTEESGVNVYADSTPLQGFAGWTLGEEPRVTPPTRSNATCVELQNTGGWSQVECDITMYYVCEFLRRGRGGGGGGIVPSAMSRDPMRTS
ncbi:collectin-10 [Osmerus mordax]|uniref:collectin-10 n=1 Tax=Osmerus mordax TaxID=8014 RepID=UPI00350F94B8